MRIAKIVIDQNTHQIDRAYDYAIPESIEDEVMEGSVVEVPFGQGNRKHRGYVLAVTETEKPKYRLKKINGVVRKVPPFSKEQIRLILWMRKEYACRLIEAIHSVGPPKAYGKVKEPEETWVELRVPKAGIQGEIQLLPGQATAQKKILQYLEERGKSQWKRMEKDLEVGIGSVKTLEKKGLIGVIKVSTPFPELMSDPEEIEPQLMLSEEQQNALVHLRKGLKEGNAPRSYLLHGITGSGKTEIYLDLMGEVVEKGKTGILLVPEISLTPQMLGRFTERFGKQVALFHSSLSMKQRYGQWKKVEEGTARIVIGARSAIFAPLKNLGLIILDEEHETTYKSEQSPKYHAREIAEYRSKQEGALLLLGSATPSMESYYKAEKGELFRITLKKRPTMHQLPKVKLVDMKEELNRGNRDMLSAVLKEKIHDRLEKNEQVILFLNRRGYASYITCRKCGYVQTCGNCDVTMTYHRKNHQVMCHYCGERSHPIEVCPECENEKMRKVGSGTQRLEESIQGSFPKAKIGRLDTDALSEKGSHEKILEAFQSKEVEILIGTQMIAKGLDFPNVTLVGILSGDNSLHLPDFRASERTFQLLTQVSGRAGRGTEQGEVILQTYKPDHYSIRAALEQNYETFYRQEIMMRELFNYPPFKELFMINFMGNEESVVAETANRVAEVIQYILKSENEKLDVDEVVLGPNPSVISKINRNYRYRLMLKDVGVSKSLLKKVIKYVCINKRNKYVPQEVHLSIDFNPYHLM